MSQLEFFNVFNIEQQLPIQESILPQYRLRSVRPISVSVGVQMSSIKAAPRKRHRDSLEAQLSELNRLRDQLRKAQLSARGSRRISHRNCKD
jgi:hypothetical protein